MDFRDLLKERILILDGGLGTCIQQKCLTGHDGNNDALPMTHPDVIESIHKAYVDAGADLISTCSFSANAISQEGYGLQDKVREMNLAAAAVARKAADSTDRKVWVLGSMGPTPKSLFITEMMGMPLETFTYDSLKAAYAEQADALIEGGVDGLLVETVTDPRNAEAALDAIREVQQKRGTALPVMVSASLMNNSGCLMTGTPLQELYDTISPYGIDSFGLNCSFGAKELYPFIQEIGGFAKCAVSIYPNAGLPGPNGYEETPEITAQALHEMAADGLVNIAGGCCGTTPEHIKAVAESLRGLAPRKY